MLTIPVTKHFLVADSYKSTLSSIAISWIIRYITLECDAAGNGWALQEYVLQRTLFLAATVLLKQQLKLQHQHTNGVVV